MKHTFTAHSHHNILATHRTTLEITKDTQLTKKGNCIVAVGADFSLQRIRELIGSCGEDGEIIVTIEAAGLKEEIIAVVNKGFNSDREIVLRKGSFVSERTLGTNANKAAAKLSRELAERLKTANMAVSVTIETHEIRHTS
ncbi:DUF371 domain-containing protein [Candidatus Woesearchaeota archaeon]|nr:DUF371 domain-containing protein [Candidatus Woesearchaeota archaeon]